ncbi:MAG: TatD family hydrolase [Pelovirga sp.]
MRFCDTHIHLSGIDGPQRLNACLVEADDAGIDCLLQPGVRPADWDGILALADRYPQVYAAPGLHPMCADQWNKDVEKQLRQLVRHPKVVAIGEIGLDATVESSIQVQEKVLRDQLQVALDEHLPVILHCRHKNGALLDILRELAIGRQVGAIWHGFSASLPFARQVVDQGVCVGIGPVLLRDNVRRLLETVTGLPDSVLLLETDLPDMAQKPIDLIKVAEKIADLRGISLAQTAQLTTANTRRLFHRLQDNGK